MGALKPWHILVLLACTAVVVTIGALLVAEIVRRRRR
jgi:hypothetical protein